MRGLRTLSFLGALLSFPALALRQSLATTAEVEARRSPVGPAVADADIATGTSATKETLSYQADAVANIFGLEAALTSVQPNYSGFLVRDQGGNQTPLSAQFPTGRSEWVGASKVTWQKSANAVVAGFNGNLNTSPFRQWGANLSYERSFYDATSVAGLKLDYVELHQPDSFFINQDFSNQERPTLLHGFKTALSFDQVLTERWKLRAEVSSSQRPEDRPRAFEFSLGQAYALLDRVFARVKVRRAWETQSQALLDERGYFSNFSTEFAVTVEPLYDFLLTASYTFLREDEVDPRVGTNTVVGSDQYALALSYLWQRLKFDFKGTYAFTNVNLGDSRFIGGLTWQL